MERYIGMDVHAASCTLDFPVETNGQALVEAVRMLPGHKHLVRGGSAAKKCAIVATARRSSNWRRAPGIRTSSPENGCCPS